MHCLQGSWGAELHPDLDVVEGGEFVKKGTEGQDGYSAFSMRDPTSGATSGTVLESILRGHGIEQLVIVGLATDYCVKETALDALAKAFRVTVPLRGVRAVNLNPGDGERAIADIREAGAEVDSQLGQQPASDEGADDTDADVGDDAVAGAANNLSGKPARDQADQQNHENRFVRHARFLPFATTVVADPDN